MVLLVLRQGASHEPSSEGSEEQGESGGPVLSRGTDCRKSCIDTRHISDRRFGHEEPRLICLTVVAAAWSRDVEGSVTVGSL